MEREVDGQAIEQRRIEGGEQEEGKRRTKGKWRTQDGDLREVGEEEHGGESCGTDGQALDEDRLEKRRKLRVAGEVGDSEERVKVGAALRRFLAAQE